MQKLSKHTWISKTLKSWPRTCRWLYVDF